MDEHIVAAMGSAPANFALHRFPCPMKVKISQSDKGDIRGKLENGKIMVFRFGQDEGSTSRLRNGASFFEPNYEHYEQCLAYMMKIIGSNWDGYGVGRFASNTPAIFERNCSVADCQSIHWAGLQTEPMHPNTGTPILGRHWVFYPLEKMSLLCFESLVATFHKDHCLSLTESEEETVDTVTKLEEETVNTIETQSRSTRFWEAISADNIKISRAERVGSCMDHLIELDPDLDNDTNYLMGALDAYASHDLTYPNDILTSMQLCKAISAEGLDISDVLKFNMFTSVIENALKNYVSGAYLMEFNFMDGIRVIFNETLETCITLECTRIFDLGSVVPVPRLWSLTGYIKNFDHARYDEYLWETPGEVILRAMTMNNIGDVATVEHMEKRLSTCVICGGSIQVIIPALSRPLKGPQSIACSGQVIHFRKCEEISEVDMNEATCDEVAMKLRFSDTQLRVGIVLEERSQWEVYTRHWTRCNGWNDDRKRCGTLVRNDMSCKDHTRRRSNRYYDDYSHLFDCEGRSTDPCITLYQG